MNIVEERDQWRNLAIARGHLLDSRANGHTGADKHLAAARKARKALEQAGHKTAGP